ncbi:Protein C23H3.9 d [Aphelenchoides avenae]|nr:Protein C23H3.9 d [Aphelenchus avenae]
MANKHALPETAQQALASASEGDFATTILRIFGFKSVSKSTVTKERLVSLTTLTTPVPHSSSTAKPRSAPFVAGDVCPFNASPLMQGNDYVYCKPSSPGACPVDYVCDQSFVLGRSICCRDRPRSSEAQTKAAIKSSILTSKRPPIRWNSTPLPPSAATLPPLGPPTTKRAPWYIKDRDRTPAPTLLGFQTTTERTRNPWARLWSTTTAAPNLVNVTVMQTGSISTLRDGQIESIGAITLINDNGIWTLVDTGAASETEILLRSLARESVALEDISTVVITHGHPGHMGNMNFFGQKPILFHSMEYIGHHIMPTELKDRPYRKLSTNIEVWKTPGHTQHDLSVIVHNVAGYGSMAIVGDLIPSEQFVSDRTDQMNEEGVWDVMIKRQNANLIICMVDWVIPGHGRPFRVLATYRQQAGCARRQRRRL